MNSTASTNLDIHKVGAIYAGFMHELKLRLGRIEAALHRLAEAGESETAFLDAEYCPLELPRSGKIVLLPFERSEKNMNQPSLRRRVYHSPVRLRIPLPRRDPVVRVDEVRNELCLAGANMLLPLVPELSV